ncbi:MAG TPA: SRPBCC family protein [Streptosporangiaceae bacterium]
MPPTLTIIAGVTVRASPERVWELAVDWPRQREWIWATRTEGGHAPGAGVTARTAIGPVGFTDTMVITDWEPPRRCVLTHTGPVVRGEGVFEVIPRGERSEFRWTERIVLPSPLPPALAGLAFPLIAPVARLGLGSSLLRFARLVEPRRRADGGLLARIRIGSVR